VRWALEHRFAHRRPHTAQQQVSACFCRRLVRSHAQPLLALQNFRHPGRLALVQQTRAITHVLKTENMARLVSE